MSNPERKGGSQLISGAVVIAILGAVGASAYGRISSQENSESPRTTPISTNMPDATRYPSGPSATPTRTPNTTATAFADMLHKTVVAAIEESQRGQAEKVRLGLVLTPTPNTEMTRAVELKATGTRMAERSPKSIRTPTARY